MLCQVSKTPLGILLVQQVKDGVQLAVDHRKIVVLNIGDQVLDITVRRLLISGNHQAQLFLGTGNRHVQQVRIV